VVGIYAFVLPVWAILAAMGFVIPNAPAVALTRHPDAAGTAAALLGAGQFGLGAAVAPLVGVLGNDELALAAVMTAGSVIALLALLAVGGAGAGEDVAAPGVAVADAV
jgi:DHA1 family bicyclomycin/chloramphenicol resistance-like MFS transporter